MTLPPPSPPNQKDLLRPIHLVKSHPSLSPFRRRVYLVLLSVPPGRWTTYAALARYMATSPSTSSTSTTTVPKKKKNTSTGSARAVGTAMRTNPFAPDVPCHRVLAADASLGGYMGDGPSSGGANLRRKREMLEAEGVRFSDCSKGRVRAEGECFVDFVG